MGPSPTPLVGRRVLVVEDEALVSMLIEQMLEDLGCFVVGPATTIAGALALAGDGEAIDMALLDVNLSGERVFPVAEALERLGVPFAFSTGYGEGGLPEEWRGRPTLQKPYSFDDVIVALGALASAKA
ncbi:MAG: response regulator [Proteobacteria bacterium]|nr:response regulator [Pseudomonadota bacterium]